MKKPGAARSPAGREAEELGHRRSFSEPREEAVANDSAIDSLKSALRGAQHLRKELKECRASKQVVPAHQLTNDAKGSLLQLTDAPGAIPEWPRVIQSAKHRIGILAYIFDLAGEAWFPVAGALCEARQRGVEVRVVIDASWGKGTRVRNLRPTVQRLTRYGVMVRTSQDQKKAPFDVYRQL